VRLLTYAVAAKLWADGIRVNAIHPGLIEATMTTIGSRAPTPKPTSCRQSRHDGRPTRGRRGRGAVSRERPLGLRDRRIARRRRRDDELTV